MNILSQGLHDCKTALLSACLFVFLANEVYPYFRSSYWLWFI